tara:strand:+ start:1015 stop:1263 length:249 start_codon:yes stop_codon:yes gene_type:complete
MIDPTDKKQCQAMIPNGYTFMTMGGVPGLVRCTRSPIVIATESAPDENGEYGHMSLCVECLVVATGQLPDGYFKIKKIEVGG